ncbi:MAG: hypothetical protein KF891_06705 [Rhizobacter sp.]|nr:hypothetical protein [Rhizobacter sp.]
MTIPHSTLRRTLLATLAASAVLLAGCATPGAGDTGKTPGTMNPRHCASSMTSSPATPPPAACRAP